MSESNYSNQSSEDIGFSFLMLNTPSTANTWVAKPRDEPLAPIDLVNKILISDPAILGVVAADSKGNKLASAVKGEAPEKAGLSEDFFDRRAELVAIVGGMASQEEAMFGHFQSMVMNFEKARIVVLDVPEFGISFGIRLIRSANVDYVTNSVLTLLGLVRRTERNRRAAGVEARPEEQ